MPIGPALRKYLDSVDRSDLMQAVDLGDLEYHVRGLRKRYASMSDTNLARLLLELTSGIQEAMAEIEGARVVPEDLGIPAPVPWKLDHSRPLSGEEVRLAVQNWCASQAILAAALTRKERGRPPLWTE